MSRSVDPDEDVCRLKLETEKEKREKTAGVYRSPEINSLISILLPWQQETKPELSEGWRRRDGGRGGRGMIGMRRGDVLEEVIRDERR